MNVDKMRIETDSFGLVECLVECPPRIIEARNATLPRPFRDRLANHAVGDRSRLGDGQAR
jgi:hypothetical protein